MPALRLYIVTQRNLFFKLYSLKFTLTIMSFRNRLMVCLIPSDIYSAMILLIISLGFDRFFKSF